MHDRNQTDAAPSANLHRQAHALVVPLPEPLTKDALNPIRCQALVALKSVALTTVVLDFGLVDSVDSEVLHGCEQLVGAAKLLGATITVAALRPHVAATIVQLGDFFSDISVARSVHDAVQVSFGSRT